MIMFPPSILMALAISILVKQQVRAHPGEKFDKRARLEELTRHHVVAEVNSRALQACAAQPKVQARRKQAIARRAATFERLRQDAGLSEGKFPRTRSYAEPLEGHGALTGISQPPFCTAATLPILKSGLQ